MKTAWMILLFVAPAFAQPQESASPANEAKTMIVGVAHDDSIMGGGIGGSHFLPPGNAKVQPIAWLTPAGEWVKIDCNAGATQACRRFDRDYLSKPHTYTVISADGLGSQLHVDKMELDHECFGFGGDGAFTGGPIQSAAVAAESEAIFTPGISAHRLPEQEAQPIRRALQAAAGTKLDSIEELRVYSVSLEGHSLFVIQRAFQDYASKPKFAPGHHVNLYFILAIGEMSDGHFRLLHWKENTDDDNEQILGLVHLKTGRDFLVDASSDPESNSFRVYGIRDGKLSVVFEGSGGSC